MLMSDKPDERAREDQRRPERWNIFEQICGWSQRSLKIFKNRNSRNFMNFVNIFHEPGSCYENVIIHVVKWAWLSIHLWARTKVWMKLMNELCLAEYERDRHRRESKKVTKDFAWMEPVNVMKSCSPTSSYLKSASIDGTHGVCTTGLEFLMEKIITEIKLLPASQYIRDILWMNAEKMALQKILKP